MFRRFDRVSVVLARGRLIFRRLTGARFHFFALAQTQYQVLRDETRLYDAFYKLADSREQIRSYVFDAVRSTVPRIKLDDLFESKEEIAVGVKDALSKSMEGFGYQIMNTLVTVITPDYSRRIISDDLQVAYVQQAPAKVIASDYSRDDLQVAHVQQAPAKVIASDYRRDYREADSTKNDDLLPSV